MSDMNDFYTATLETALRRIWLLLDSGSYAAQQRGERYPAMALDAKKIVESLGLIPDEDLARGAA